MATDDPNSWRTPTFRQSMIAKIEENIQKFQMPIVKNATDMENHVFMKAKTKEDYLNFIARLVLHITQLNNKKPAGTMAPNNATVGVQQGMPDPIGALQTLARQGTGNNTNMTMQVPVQNSQNMVPQQAQGPTTNPNLLQTLNQQPGQPMSMPVMHNKMPGQPGCPPMGPMQNMQTNPMMAQMNQMNQANMGQRMGPQPGQQLGVPQINVAQMGPNQMQVIQVKCNQLQNQMGGHQLGGPMSTGMQAPPQQQHMNQLNPAQIAANQLAQAQLGHMQRKPVDMMTSGFPGPRNVTPNQFLRQSPSPSAPSPGGIGVSTSTSQMVASPALVGSPNPQHMLATAQRPITMAPSPSSSLNTPAGALGATPSPLQDDQISQACKEKIQKLRKFIDPLNKMIIKLTNEGYTEKISKVKKLLEILTNPSSVTKLDVLQKCEVVLEKMELKKFETTTGPQIPSSLKEHYFLTPLLEVVNTILQNPVANHTLHRTFSPCVEALFGPEIKDLPPKPKRRKVEEPTSEIPDVLQGEIARLDQRFKVSLDPAQQSGSKCIQLICWLDDKHLPCVPPVLVIVPMDYPKVPPKCVLASHEYATPYLSAVQNALDARLDKLPKQFSISQLLDTWETSVRQASAPKFCQQQKLELLEHVTLADTSTTVTATTTTAVTTTTVLSTTVPVANGLTSSNLITTASS
ncbi:mediator of RNA polymerase II transcription subunit 15-like [Copidosoma floridanum]|uniref:mediator of RNA polymerase II transcription subunit 15-like n=1 Tax=Copidosoma floridanum TaxID=29053 RepID=UPI000C6FC451|nr:mediator of RNA polymerase II transcription subunit 15-like [Copidosoma floridanum]